jgi:hypothetical protein
MEKYRSCVVCSKQGNVMLYAGCPHEHFGIVSASKFCRVIVALKTLAPSQQIMMIEISGAKAAVLEHPCFLTCIITSQSSIVEKHELIFDAWQIAHLFELFYSEEIGLIVHRERAVVSAAADSYSVNTEMNFSEESTLPSGGKLFADFASNFVDKLLLREPLCSEWILPLTSADDIVGCSLVSSDGVEILKLPAQICPDVVHFGYRDLLRCCATIQSVIDQAMEMMKLMNDKEAELKESTAMASLDTSRLEGQRQTPRVVNLGTHGPNSYQALLLPISNGPMNVSLCLIVYYWFSTAACLCTGGPLSTLTSNASHDSDVMSQAVDDSSRPFDPCSSHPASSRGNGSDIVRFQKWNTPAGPIVEYTFAVFFF